MLRKDTIAELSKMVREAKGQGFIVSSALKKELLDCLLA
jgi:hypothetical protein